MSPWQSSTEDFISDNVEVMESGSVVGNGAIISMETGGSRRCHNPKLQALIEKNVIVVGQAIQVSWERNKYFYYGRIDADGSIFFRNPDGTALNFSSPSKFADYVYDVKNESYMVVPPKTKKNESNLITHGEYEKQRRIKRGGKETTVIHHDGRDKARFIFHDGTKWVFIKVCTLLKDENRTAVLYNHLQPVMYDTVMGSLCQSITTIQQQNSVNQEVEAVRTIISEIPEHEEQIKFLLDHIAIQKQFALQARQTDDAILQQSREAYLYAAEELRQVPQLDWPESMSLHDILNNFTTEGSHFDDDDSSSSSEQPITTVVTAECEDSESEQFAPTQFQPFSIHSKTSATKRRKLLVIRYDRDITDNLF